jgi:hypothetical protein
MAYRHPLLKPFYGGLRGRFPCFAPISSHSPQKWALLKSGGKPQQLAGGKHVIGLSSDPLLGFSTESGQDPQKSSNIRAIYHKHQGAMQLQL